MLQPSSRKSTACFEPSQACNMVGRKMRCATLALVALAVVLAHGRRAAAGTRLRPLAGQSSCPPPGFDALKDFSIKTYIAQRWYVQQQLPLVYQPVDQLYCTTADYLPLNASNPLAGLRVLNRARQGSVDGPAVGTAGDQGLRLIATVPDPKQPAKLQVGFALFGNRQLLPGPYWVVAAGQSADPAQRSGNAYDWAIIVGGEPRVRTQSGCATGSTIPLFRLFQTNGIGLWLFSRRPVDPANTQVMLGKLRELGLDGSGLLPVQQQGCTYQG